MNGAGWDYGANLAYLRELVAYWQDGFDWRQQEARLTDPGARSAPRRRGDPAQSFDVVVPSLPGSGFCDRPRQPDLVTSRIAELWVDLMARLGYERCGCGAYTQLNLV